MTSTDLARKYREILSSPVDTRSCESGECVSLLFDAEWVKIMIVRSPESTELCSIEIEISLPACIIEPTLLSPTDTQNEARAFVKSTISHLDYFLRLQDLGFKLGIISDEGIWSAVLDAKDANIAALFDTLIPPSCL